MSKKYAVTKTFTFEGKRYYIHADTEKEAFKKMALRKRDLEEGRIKESNITVSDWTEKAMDTYKQNVSTKTRKDTIWLINRYIKPKIGNKQIKRVTNLECQSILNQMENMSERSIEGIYQTLRFIFKTAKQNHLIREDPTENIVMPKGKPRVNRAMTRDEEEKFLKLTKDTDKYLVYELMYYCGCRPAEAMNCKGGDIENIDGVEVLHIRGTKTVNADRYVPIPKEFLKKIRGIGKNAYIANVTNRTKYFRLNKKFYEDMNSAEDFRPYILRHTYCTNLCRKGVDIRIAQSLMGHSDIRMTSNIYTHTDTSLILEAAKLIV